MDVLNLSKIIQLFSPLFIFSASFLLTVNTIILVIYLRPILTVIIRGMKEIVTELKSIHVYLADINKKD